MKTVSFVPTICQGENPKMTGSVVLRVPTFNEKMRYMREPGFDISEKGEIDMGPAMKRLEFIARFVELSEAHYVSVSLKKSDGQEIKSYQEMQDDDECHPILMEIGGLLLGGFKMGNG